MKEIEVKFRVRDFDAVRVKLKKLGGVLEWQGVEKSEFFRLPLAARAPGGAHLRLKTGDGKAAALTLKIPPTRKDPKFKIIEELEVSVSDPPVLRAILRHTGFVKGIAYEKRREHWRVRGAHVELDEVLGARFVEIEGPKWKIEELAKFLGLDWRQATTLGYARIIRDLKRAEPRALSAKFRPRA